MRNKSSSQILDLVVRSVSCLLLVGAAGCATKPPVKAARIVFPSPPDEPRIQYLTSYGSESDLGKPSKFAQYVLGGTPMVVRPIWKPYGVAATKGKIHVCDTQAGNVSAADLVKRKLRYLKPAGEAAIKLPLCVAVDAAGTRYITDSKRDQVLMYDNKDNFLGALGKKGEMKPRGVAVSGDRLYVTDIGNHCVRVYRLADRELLFTAPRDPSDEKGKLHGPTNIAVDRDGRMYVTDTGGFKVHIFDSEGRHVRDVGDQGADAGRFAMPKGIGVDREGRIYVVDAAAAVVQLFDNEGRLLMYFGYPRESGPASLYLPAGLAVDYENVDLFQKDAPPGYKFEYLILVVNQVGPRKVSIFGFLQKN